MKSLLIVLLIGLVLVAAWASIDLFLVPRQVAVIPRVFDGFLTKVEYIEVVREVEVPGPTVEVEKIVVVVEPVPPPAPAQAEVEVEVPGPAVILPKTFGSDGEDEGT